MSIDVPRPRRLRASSILSEAWRKLVTGTSRPLLVVLLTAAVLAALALADVRAIVGLSASAAQRATAPALLLAAVAGLLVGAGCVRVRRLELASALHAQVPRGALVAQLGLELLTLMLATAVVLLPVTLLAATHANPDPPWPAWSAGLRIVAAGTSGVLVGGLLAAATTSEKRLFRYLKER